jgi:alkylated DNA repair protein (DNA oxidative demethylase)
VPKTLPGTGDPAAGLPSGQLNITLRESGLAGPDSAAGPDAAAGRAGPQATGHAG